MNQTPTYDDGIRPGEVAAPLPAATDAGVYFLGVIHTPWKTRQECPRRGSHDGPECRIALAPRWQPALAGLEAHARIQVLYWMHHSRRDLLLQMPRSAAAPIGTFALRSPVRPNPIASSVVLLERIEGATLVVRGMDCIDGTPVVDIKPERTVHAPQGA